MGMSVPEFHERRNQTMAGGLNLEKLLAGLSAEARARVESALKDALAKEGAASAFDRSGFDRGPYDRGGANISDLPDPERVFVEKGQDLAR
jgi:hypothetical protein